MLTSSPSYWIIRSLAVIGIINLFEMGELWLFAVVFWPILFIVGEESKAR